MCLTLPNSQLGQQCEVLLIYIADRQSVLDLINKMIHLRTLILLCRDDPFPQPEKRNLFNNDELLK
jgi:hypothetical protein